MEEEKSCLARDKRMEINAYVVVLFIENKCEDGENLSIIIIISVSIHSHSQTKEWKMNENYLSGKNMKKFFRKDSSDYFKSFTIFCTLWEFISPKWCFFTFFSSSFSSFFRVNCSKWLWSGRRFIELWA